MLSTLARHVILKAFIVLHLILLVLGSCDTIQLPECECRYPMAKRYEIACEYAGLKNLPAKVNYTLSEGYAAGNFSYNQISSIPDFYFFNMRHFDILDFSSNRISKLSPHTFQGLETRLTSLNLSKNLINSVPRQTFREYIRLKELDLSENSLSSPCSLHTADVLDYSLAGNGIVKLENQCFSDSTKVTRLDLSNNRISKIEPEAFTGLTSLKELNLANNDLADVEGGLDTLTGVANFKYLSLRGNKLRYMNSICKYTFSSLGSLDLGYNKLADIQKYCFLDYSRSADDVSLELNFEHNEIKSLAASAFAGLGSRLSRLRLNNNRISSVNIDTFKDQQALVDLNLDDNQLSDLEFLRHWDNNILRKLSVANNLISGLSQSIFSKMLVLEELNLDGNRLLRLESNAFKGMPKLLDLSIEYNLLTNMDENTFIGLDNLQKLGLSGNALVTMKNCTFAGLKHLQQFHFVDNLMYCDCDLLWLLKFMQNVNSNGQTARNRQESKVTKPVLEDYCHYPHSVAGKFLQNQVSENCVDSPPDICFSLAVTIDEPDGDGKTNVTWRWDANKAGSRAQAVTISQIDVKTNETLFNDSVIGSEPLRTLSGFVDEKVYKVCVTVMLANGEHQKDCRIWPSMIKKPSTPAPPTTKVRSVGMHPGTKAAIALTVILIIIITIIIVLAVYLWKTQKYRQLLPDKYKSAQGESEKGSLQKSPNSNGSSRDQDTLAYRPPEERHLMKNDGDDGANAHNT